MTRLCTAVLALATSLGMTWTSSDARQDTLRARAHRLHHDALVVDTHADLTPFIEIDTRVPTIGDPGMAGPGYDRAADAARQPVLQTDAWYRTFPSGPWRFTERHTDGYGYGVPAPVGLEDVSKLEAITYELLARGFDERTVRKVLGENTLRVMGEAERVAARLSGSR